jgi:glycosyltransferase involved in cell wall biosynthesis
MSTDNTVSIIESLIKDDSRFVLIKNTEKKLKTRNFVELFDTDEFDDEDIIVELDGDDHLFDEKVLQKVVDVYNSGDIWITNGSFVYANGFIGFSSPQVNFNTLRKDRFTASHLRTWKVFLWRNIEDEDHKDKNGEYFKCNPDLAYMLPMLEMAGPKHYKYIPDFMLVYNDQNPLNEHKVDMKMVTELAEEIRNRKKYNLLRW